MPQENRKRGRRAEKKRKTEEPAPEEALEQLYLEDTNGDAEFPGDDTTTFYGLLTEEESEYFARAAEMLEMNQFGDEEEKSLFIGNLYQEAVGKELKIAHSQGCSRLMERLILLSTPAQLKHLLQCFTGHYLNLVKHRFASHVCETLFIQAAPLVSREMDTQYAENAEVPTDDDTPFASMESLFLFMVNEIEPELKQLITHTFASHTLRTLLLLLSGRPVTSASTLVQSRKKENIPLNSENNNAKEETAQISVVPQSFHEAVKKILELVNVAFTTEELRMLAVHQIGSPALQIMLQLEMGLSKKDRRTKEKQGGTLLGKLTGITTKDEEAAAAEAAAEEEGTEASVEKGFFQNLLYDPVGSHLAEAMMRSAPKKDFNMLYKRFIRPRLGALTRNETAAFVVQRVLEKLTKEGLEEAVKEILPQVPGLVERSRVAVLRTLIDACTKQSVDPTALVSAIATAYSASPADLIFKLLHLTPEDLVPVSMEPARINAPAKPKRDPNQLHGSLLAQSILSLPAEFAQPIADSILEQNPDTLVALCKHPTASHSVQKILNSPHASTPNKRKLLNKLRGRFVELAMDNIASHIVDVCWDTPMNYRQSIAEELLRQEPEIRESYSGRAVWRNWAMDKYKTRKQQWFLIGKEDAAVPEKTFGKPAERKKTAIELARERHAQKKAGNFSYGTGANGPLGKRRGAPTEEQEEAGKKQKVE